MAELKTKQNDASVQQFISSLDDEAKITDSLRLLDIFQELTGEQPKMWGPSIIGFGQYHYKYASGQEGDWMLVGFSPRKAALSLYLSTGFEVNQDLLAKIGKHKMGKGCLYITRLSDVDESALRQLISWCYDAMKKYAATMS